MILTNGKGRPQALGDYTTEEVQAKAIELKNLKKTAEFYGVATSTVKKKIGDIKYRGVTDQHVEDIRRMSKTHTKPATAELLGYSVNQIVAVCVKHKISFDQSRKPRKNSNLTHYEMNNMDVIVKQYRTAEECAEEHEVSTRCIQEHVAKCKKARKLQEQAEDCELPF